ncbi:LysR family transcriptional regulator [Limosilactobacillus viscerum]|uniref:LysR family transcriptional regulator n=1 Tax=Limosilactobacillus viscerum TaxID=2993450 RepID=UPI0024BAB5B6|nr:LysR family transcriptional regulator [Limosilactobacillus viscerum]
MNLKQLQEFLVVAQERQITSAAKRLYMAQPPLSYQMKQLEKELGVKLFTRNSYGIDLTPAGKTFQAYAQEMVKTRQAAIEALDQEKTGRLGTIHLGLISSTGALVPTPALRQLTADYPRVNFEISEGNTMQLIDQVNSNLIDIAIVRTPFNMRGLTARTLYHDKLVAVGDHERFNFPDNEFSITDFDQQPLILYRRFESIFNQTFAQHGVEPFYSVKCDDARTALMWANNGMGIAIVPRLIAKSYARLPITPINYQAWNSSIQVVWQKGAKLKPVTKRFINLLTKEA